MDYYQFPEFKAHGCLAAFSTARQNLSFHNNPALAQNRRDFLKSLSINYRDIVASKQAHSANVLIASNLHKGRGALNYGSAVDGYDALITQEPNLPLSMFSADCLSIFVMDIVKKACAIVHAGWRPTRDKITIKALQLMRKEFGSQTGNLIAGFGPCIRKCCYEVGKEFENYFSEGLSQAKERFYLDLAELNRKQLLEAGVLEENITDPGICTVCNNSRFFSFRKEGKSAGRMMSVIMLE